MFSLPLRILGLFLLNGVLCSCDGEFTVPRPTFELIYPRGFSVKIPHSDGISVFAFHGKINERMESLEAGEFSKDILKKSGDYWIFEDRSSLLQVGDKIYFWLFVIKNKLGYRFDDGEFTVREDTPFRTEGVPKETTTFSTVTNNELTTRPNEIPSFSTEAVGMDDDCRNAIVNITNALVELKAEVNSLKDINVILKEISEKHPESARILKIEGRIAVNEDALNTVKGIIKQKLLLSIEIEEARRNKDGSITFKTLNLDDKVQIIKAAKEKLRYSRIFLTY